MSTFKAQLKFIRNYMDQRPDRTTEIVSQLGFPTPYFSMILGLHPVRNRYTLELIGITQIIASHVAMIAKHHLACRRPDRIDATVLPIISTPGHGSFPSAHATEAFAVAEVLKGVVEGGHEHYSDPEKRVKLIYKQAERIAVNRTVAGVHYPIDSWAGAILGRTIGQMILAKGNRHKSYVDTYKYIAKDDSDFFVKEFAKGENKVNGVSASEEFAIDRSGLFNWLWERTLDEYVVAK